MLVFLVSGDLVLNHSLGFTPCSVGAPRCVGWWDEPSEIEVLKR